MTSDREKVNEANRELLGAARLAASAIRNLEGQPVQYSLAMDLSAALARLEFCICRCEQVTSKFANIAIEGEG